MTLSADDGLDASIRTFACPHDYDQQPLVQSHQYVAMPTYNLSSGPTITYNYTPTYATTTAGTYFR